MANIKTDEIGAILDTFHSATLLEMAHAAGLDVIEGKRKLPKADLLVKVRNEFFTQERVQASLAKLSERERAVLDRLLLLGGTAPTKSLKRQVIRAGLATEVQPAEKTRSTGYRYNRDVPYARGQYCGSPHRPQSTVYEDVIARLTYHGLVFSRDTGVKTVGGAQHKLQFHPGAILYIPEIIRQYLPEPSPIPPTDAIRPDRVQPGNPELLLRDLYLYWDFIRRSPAPLVQGGAVAKRSLKAINSLLLTPDPLLDKAKGESETGRLWMLRQLLAAFKLVQDVGGQLRLTGKSALDLPEFWGWPQAKQIKACVEAWSRLGGLGELDSKASQYLPQVVHARQIVLDVLKAQPAQVWLEPEELAEQIYARDVDFLFAEHSRVEAHRSGWYYSYSGGRYYGQAPEILKSLEKYEVEFVNACLAGFLCQAGLVELGFPKESDRLLAFRLTPLGQFVLQPSLDVEMLDESNDAGRLVIQPSFQLIAMGPVSLTLLATLDLFAERQRADQGAFEYHLSRESVYRAQQLGMSTGEVIRFMEQTGHAELPQNVRRSLEEWAAHHERIVFRTGVSLLHAADASLLDRLMQDPQVGSLLARAVSPEVAMIAKKGQGKLVAALVGQGLFPAVSGAQLQSADKSVVVQEDGTVRAIHAVPSFHLRGRISRLAEETCVEGEWRLTPASISRAGGSKAQVLGILEELGKLHRGTEFPEELVERIKAWGGYYGEAAAQTLTLIEFRDQSALDELAQRPELETYLTPFPAGNRALAVVPRDKLAQVKNILADLGVRVREGLS
jgi:hypothetical protein